MLNINIKASESIEKISFSTKRNIVIYKTKQLKFLIKFTQTNVINVTQRIDLKGRRIVISIPFDMYIDYQYNEKTNLFKIISNVASITIKNKSNKNHFTTFSQIVQDDNAKEYVYIL